MTGQRIDMAPDWSEIAEIIAEAYRCVAPTTVVSHIDGRPADGTRTG